MFMHVGRDMALPALMIESVRRHMDAHVVQMTDQDTPEVPGVDEVFRIDREDTGSIEREAAAEPVPCGLMLFRMQLLACLDDHPTVILDTDCIVQKDLATALSFMGDNDAQVGLTIRNAPVMMGDFDVAKEMPYNAGVMFSRCSEFWRDCLVCVRGMPKRSQDWFGDQLAIRDVAADYAVMEFPCDPMNYSPSHPDEDVSEKFVVHYKGNKRKAWMLRACGKDVG